MVGAFTGDINGSLYEFKRKKPTRETITLFPRRSRFTDDSVATIAVMKTILENPLEEFSEENIGIFKNQLVNNFVYFIRKYNKVGWGGGFYRWGMGENHEPYGSYGNGSAMRISPVGWASNSIEQLKNLSKIVTDVTHNHPESIKGAEATSMCIFLARNHKSKEEIKKVIKENYYPNIDEYDFDELVKNYRFDVSTQGTVPVAIYAFLSSDSFEDCLIRCLEIGGDTDTLACISCSIAEAFYGINDQIKEKTLSYFNKELKGIIDKFNEKYN